MEQFARYKYCSLQEVMEQFARHGYDSLQEVMAQFARYKYGSFQDGSLQDVDINGASKNMMHCVNLNDIWAYVIMKVENA